MTWYNERMKNHVLTRFDALEKEDLVQRVDVTALEGGGSICALSTKPCESLDELKAQLRGAGVAYESLGEHAEENGGYTLVLKSAMDAEAMSQTLTQASGSGFKEYAPEEKFTDRVDMMKVRGVLGSIGQAMTFYSAWRRAKEFKDPFVGSFMGMGVRDSHMEAYSSATSMIANGINFTYGVQKKGDEAGLHLTKKRVNEVLSPYASGLLPSEYESQFRDVEAKTALGKIDDTLAQNSTVAADSLKFVAKTILAKSPTDQWLQRAGTVSQLAKVITFAGKSKDSEADRQISEQPEYDQNAVLSSVEFVLRDVFGKEAVKHFIDPLRQQAMPVSGLMEFAATGFIANSGYKAYGKAKLAGDARRMRLNSLKVAGTAVIMLGLLSKSLAPFSNRKVDKNELYAHIDAAMELLPEGTYEEHLPEVVSAMRQIPEFGDVSYTEIYAELLEHRKEKMQGAPETEVKPEMLVGQVAHPVESKYVMA